jgi:hypothetical protein
MKGKRPQATGNSKKLAAGFFPIAYCLLPIAVFKVEYSHVSWAGCDPACS